LIGSSTRNSSSVISASVIASPMLFADIKAVAAPKPSSDLTVVIRT
jgi:hypothetical protein